MDDFHLIFCVQLNFFGAILSAGMIILLQFSCFLILYGVVYQTSTLSSVFQYFVLFILQNWFRHSKQFLLLLSKTNKMKLLKYSFCTTWKFWKLLENKHFIEVWSWECVSMFLNMEWHENFLYTTMFYIVMHFWFENFKFFENDLYFIQIFFIFPSKIHNNFKFLQKILKIL